MAKFTVIQARDWQHYRDVVDTPSKPAHIRTLNEEVGGLLDEEGGAWIIKDTRNDSLCAVAADRDTAQHIVWRKSIENEIPIETYSIEVWHIWQLPEDYDDE